jgi:glucokinase
MNVRGILDLLRLHGPCSRADLVRYSGLRAPTVSSAIRHLEEGGLIQFLGQGESNGGRPPVMLRFHAEAGYVVGIDIGGTLLRIAIADLNGAVKGRWAHALKSNEKEPGTVCSIIDTALTHLLAEIGVSRDRLIAAAVGTPGITDSGRGLVVAAPNLKGWINVPLRKLLQRYLKLPIAIENDVNLAAAGEHWRGATTEEPNFVFIAIGTGVGAGIFIDGRLHRGATWSAGEIGYLQVSGTVDSTIAIHRTGQLEDSISGTSIEQAWRKQHDGPPMRATEVLEAAGAGNPVAQKILENMSLILSHAISNIALILNPSVVVIGGGVGSNSNLFESTSRLIEKNEIARPRLIQSALGADAQLFGAIFSALELAEDELVRRIA